MDNVLGSGMKKRGKVVDMLLLLGTALSVAALSTGAALVSEAYHVSPAWLLAFWAGVGFLMIIGKTYGVRKLKSARFAAFSAAWLVIHVCVFLFVLGYLGFLYYLPFLVAELFLGFMMAIWLFGPPAKGPLSRAEPGPSRFVRGGPSEACKQARANGNQYEMERADEKVRDQPLVRRRAT